MTRPARRHGPAVSPELLGRIADRLKVLADPNRLAILHALEARERNVTDLLGAVGGSQANLSKHLARLRLADVLAARREGASVYYRVVDPTAFAICRTVCGALERRAGNEREMIRTGRPTIAGHR